MRLPFYRLERHRRSVGHVLELLLVVPMAGPGLEHVLVPLAPLHLLAVDHRRQGQIGAGAHHLRVARAAPLALRVEGAAVAVLAGLAA
jgi:hypothetical protein